MPMVVMIDGPWEGQVVEMDDYPTEAFGLKVDRFGAPLDEGEAFAIADYIPTDRPGYCRCTGLRSKKGQLYSLEFMDGPAKGVRPSAKPAQLLAETLNFPLLEDESLYAGAGDITGVAVYERRKEDLRWVYRFLQIDKSTETLVPLIEQLNEEAISGAINDFYQNPNYGIYSISPTADHEQAFVQMGHRKAHVDELLAGTIEAIWRLNMDTLGSCQERPPKDDRPAGRAYVGFIRERDARRFCDILSAAGIEHEFQSKKFTVAREFKDGRPTATREFPAGNVLFAKEDIGRVEAAVKSAAGNQSG